MTRRQSNHRDQSPERKSVTPIILIPGVVGIGAMLLCVCGIGVWLFGLASLNVTPEQWDQRVKQQPDERWKKQEQQATSDQYRALAFVEYWLELLHMKNLDEPYRLTSKAFQGRVPRQKFVELLDVRPDLKERDHNWSHGIDGRPGDRFGFMFHAKGRTRFLWAAKEGNEWRLDQLEDVGPP